MTNASHFSDGRAAHSNVVRVALTSDTTSACDIEADPFGVLRDAVSSAHGLPVRGGSHNFWVAFTVSADTGAWDSYQDLSIRPHRMFGRIRVGYQPSDPLNEDAAVTHDVSTVLHELGHGWLVYHPLKFKVDGTTVESDISDWIQNNNRQRYTGPLLVGRQCEHWSSYWQADRSPMDGLAFERLGQQDSHDVWRQHRNSEDGLKVGPGGTRQITWNRFNDLDLAIMGVVDAKDAYANDNNRIRWIEPHLTSKVDYRAGVFVATRMNLRDPDNPLRQSPADFYFFGFSQDHRVLTVEQADGTVVATAQIPHVHYHPLLNHFSDVALRVLRRGDDLEFQARVDNSIGSHSRGPIDGLFDEPDRPGGKPKDFSEWQTVHTQHEPRAPLAIGLLAMTGRSQGSGNMPYLDVAFHNLEVTDTSGTDHKVHTFDALPPKSVRPISATPLTDEPVLFSPPGPIVSHELNMLRFQLRIDLPNVPGTSPCGTNTVPGLTPAPYVWEPTKDTAPKVAVKAPAGDFAFGTSARVVRSLWQRSSGGVEDALVWGDEKSAPVAGLQFDATMRDRQTKPDSNQYRVAYFIVSAGSDLGAITDAMAAHVDAVRTLVDEAFHLATLGHRALSSILHWP